MLASLLPGLRDLRTPIMVGYSWLLVGWLIFADKLPKHRPPGNGAIAHLFDLSHLVGPVATVTTLSVVAYILGAMLTIPTENRLVSYGLSCLTSADRSTAREFAKYLDAPIDRNYRSLAREFAPELKTRLLAANQEMYGEYDRFAAEASFRVNLVLPLWAITAVLVKDLNVNWQVYWRWFHHNSRNTPISSQALLHNLLTSGMIWGLVLLIAALILLVQGANRSAMSRNVLMRAVMTGAIEIPDRLKAEIDRENAKIRMAAEIRVAAGARADQAARQDWEALQAREARTAEIAGWVQDIRAADIARTVEEDGKTKEACLDEIALHGRG